MNPRVILRVNSGVVSAIGVFLLAPLAVSLIYADGSWESFLFPAAVMVPTGALGFWATRPTSQRALLYVSNRDVLLSVTLVWVLAALLGGVPYLVEGTFFNPIDSTFEAMSGFTTTGATLLSDIEAQTPSVLFWRSLTQWLGGLGIVVVFVAVAPALGFGAARLLSAEVSGIGPPRLTPRIIDTAKALLYIYLALSAAEIIALLLAGMNLYDAVVHTFTTIATGGFNPKNTSVGFYDSVAIETVLIVFMALAAVSFALYYVLYTQRRLSTLLDRELLTYLGILAGAVLFVWGVLASKVSTGTLGARPFETRRSRWSASPPQPATSPPTSIGGIPGRSSRWYC
jgi:trk system potassium uptake protein TrkH